MERILIGIIIAAVAGGFAAWAARRDRVEVAAPAAHHVPTALNREDFSNPARPWLVVVFTSASCSTCEETWMRAQHLDAEAVAVQEVEVGRDGDLHERYGIDAVPTTVIADGDGVVRGSFLGPVTTTHLWAKVAELRQPGSVPDGCSAAD
jgi:hypothetical protein